MTEVNIAIGCHEIEASDYIQFNQLGVYIILLCLRKGLTSLIIVKVLVLMAEQTMCYSKISKLKRVRLTRRDFSLM